MANRIRGAVSIIDTASTNVAYPGGGTQAKVGLIVFRATDSTGLLQLVFQSNTADIVVDMVSPVNQPNATTFRFDGNYLQSMYVKTLVAGTGYLYFR